VLDQFDGHSTEPVPPPARTQPIPAPGNPRAAFLDLSEVWARNGPGNGCGRDSLVRDFDQLARGAVQGRKPMPSVQSHERDRGQRLACGEGSVRGGGPGVPEDRSRDERRARVDISRAQRSSALPAQLSLSRERHTASGRNRRFISSSPASSLGGRAAEFGSVEERTDLEMGEEERRRPGNRSTARGSRKDVPSGAT